MRTVCPSASRDSACLRRPARGAVPPAARAFSILRCWRVQTFVKFLYAKGSARASRSEPMRATARGPCAVARSGAVDEASTAAREGACAPRKFSSRLFIFASLRLCCSNLFFRRQQTVFVFFRAERRVIIRHRRIWIADARQIRRARLRQQIAEHGIIQRRQFLFRHRAVRRR